MDNIEEYSIAEFIIQRINQLYIRLDKTDDEETKKEISIRINELERVALE